MGIVLSQTLDAFVAMIERPLGLLRSGGLLVAVEHGDDFDLFQASRGKSRQAVKATGLSTRERSKLQAKAKQGVELRLSPDRVISRTLSLPAGGRHYLEPIIENRLERLTPWLPEKVLYGFAIAPTAQDGTSDTGMIDVRFAATSREIAETSMERLAALGFQTTFLGVAGKTDDATSSIDLLRGGGDRSRIRFRRAIGRTLAVALALLGAAFLATSILEYRAERQLADLQAELMQTRQVLVDLRSGGGQPRERSLLEAKSNGGSTFALANRLAAIIPDDTYLTEMEIANDTIRLVGNSQSAPALVPLLESEPGLSGARFAAPITRSEDGRDRFEISVERTDNLPDESQNATQDTAARP